MKEKQSEPKEIGIKEPSSYVEYKNTYKEIMKKLCIEKLLEMPICKAFLNENSNSSSIYPNFFENNFMNDFHDLLEAFANNFYSLQLPPNKLGELIVKWVLIKRKEYSGNDEKFMEMIHGNKTEKGCIGCRFSLWKI